MCGSIIFSLIESYIFIDITDNRANSVNEYVAC